jgi:MFS transporter, DHA1 family, solute carrier family 18 (vesicular amine transporter), member 1/2
MSLRRSRAVAVALITCATFTDLVAYSIAIPVLPDLSRKLGASPTMIGFLFASFGVTLLLVSVPMGAVSDRIGRQGPLVGGMAALAAASLIFAFANTLPWLFAARLVQGAADAVTWVVGFALIADLYPPNERGRVTGTVMMGTSFAIMVGPTIGGWLYELGGMRTPFIAVAALATIVFFLLLWYEVPPQRAEGDIVPLGLVLRVPAIAACAIVVIAISGTVSMLEPVLSLHLGTLGVNPARIGMVYGIAAVITTTMHPVTGRLADRFGSREMTMLGLVMAACTLPPLGFAWSYGSALALFILTAASRTFIITPSLTYMGEATSNAGVRSFGVAYGLYNLAWGAGLLGGPALGGFLFERIGFRNILLLWAPSLALVTILLWRVKSERPQPTAATPS